MKFTINLSYFIQPLARYLWFLFPVAEAFGKATIAVADGICSGGYAQAMIDFDNL